MQIKKVTILLNNMPLDGYILDNEWFMDILGLGMLLGKSENHPREFVRSRWLQSRVKGGFEPIKIFKEDGSDIEVIPIDIVKLYLRKEDKYGNPIAENIIDLLVLSNLKNRFEFILDSNFRYN